MKILFVFGTVCLAATSAGIAGFGSFQSSGGGGGANGGYSDQSSLSGGGGYSGSTQGGSSGFNLFGSGGGFGGGNGQSGGFGVSGQGGGLLGGSLGGLGGNRNAGNGFGSSQIGSANGPSLNQQGGQVRRFVSVHVAPEESVSTEPRIIRAGGPADTHYNIIFVKAPSANNQQQTEVVLPEQPQQKTLVYVLVKKPEENQDNVKIRAPAPTKPSKPEVFFIRYKPDSDPTSGIAGGAGGSQGANGNSFAGNNGFGLSSGSGSGGIGSSYGPPSQQNGGGGYQ